MRRETHPTRGQRRDRTRALVECFPPVLASGRRWGARCWRRGMLQFPHTSLVCRSSFSRLRGACKGRFRPGRSRRWHGRSSRYVLGVIGVLGFRGRPVRWPACPMAASSGSSFTRLFADSLICSRLSAFAGARPAEKRQGFQGKDVSVPPSKSVPVRVHSIGCHDATASMPGHAGRKAGREALPDASVPDPQGCFSGARGHADDCRAFGHDVRAGCCCSETCGRVCAIPGVESQAAAWGAAICDIHGGGGIEAGVCQVDGYRREPADRGDQAD